MITRRAVLQTLAAGAAGALLPERARGERRTVPDARAKAMLYDSAACIGCRECVVGCAEEYGWEPSFAFGYDPELSEVCPTVLQRFMEEDGECFRKLQCMHCVEAACVSACMLGAMHKDEDGAVVWDADLCVGCRYCQIACPFQVPRFEWNTPVPKLVKCEMCPERRAEGRPPACVEQCRRGALLFGTREEMLAEAHRRIAADPAKYNPKVYGEHNGGGTSLLYLARAGVAFTDLGLPELGEESVVALPESIQHTLYRGFAAPLALFGLLGATVWRNARKLRAEAAEHHRTERAAPVGGTLMTPTFGAAMTLLVIGVVTILWRYSVGLGPTTNLSDGYPMGLWIAFDVVTGTALACGGYAVALLVYIANRGCYHPLVRPALVTSALGYTLGGLSVLVDIGRPWNFYKIPLYFWHWNFSSILLEVALCIMLYTAVLWIEVSPAILERLRDGRRDRVARISAAVLPGLERALPFFIALGLLLPTMHQSSLGSMMLMAGQKLHPLWHTPLLPLLFLISCVAMGYAAVTLESCLSARAFRRPPELPMLRALSVPMAGVLLLYAAVRTVDVARAGELALVGRVDGLGPLFLAEMALFVLPAVALLVHGRRAGPGSLSVMAVVVILAGALYRFSTYLFAYDPGPKWSYFPAIPEFAVTVGFISAEVLGYLVVVRRFPILRGAAAGRAREAPSPAVAPAATKQEPSHVIVPA